jgi:hypothetical protein
MSRTSMPANATVATRAITDASPSRQKPERKPGAAEMQPNGAQYDSLLA